MNLAELGFHKYAGAQAEFYKALKPSLLKALNSRRPTETKRRLNVMMRNLFRVSNTGGDPSGGRLFTSLHNTRGPHAKLGIK